MAEILRIGSVGTSSVMNVIQEAIRLTEGLTCSVVYSRSAERGEAYAKKVGVNEVCTDFEELVSRDDLDIIYIASPNTCHVEQTLKALSHGKHVFLEKPAALTRADIDLLHQTARKNGVYCFEAITTLFMPNYLACKELLPALGKISSARIAYGQYSSKLNDYKNGVVASSLDPNKAGGALNDMGIYCIHAAIDLFGIPEAVSYQPEYGFNGVDLEGVMELQYPDFICRIEASKQRDIGSGCHVTGENGFFCEEGPMNDFVTCRAGIGGDEFAICRHGRENRMIYEMARFRDAIVGRDDAFAYRMYHQSRAAAGVLEDAWKKAKA